MDWYIKLLPGLYTVSDIQDSFEYILRKYGENTDNLSIVIYANLIENRVAFKVKTEYHLDILPPETRKLLESTKNKITTDTYLEITEVILGQCNIFNNNCRQESAFNN